MEEKKQWKTTAANKVAGVFSKVIKTGAELLNDNVIPAVKSMADDNKKD